MEVWRFLLFFPFSLCYLLNPVNICLKLSFMFCVFFSQQNSTAIVKGALPSKYAISLHIVPAKMILSYTSTKE